MNGDYQPKIQRITEAAQIQPDGKVVPMVTVIYMIGVHGPFSAQFPSKDFTADLARHGRNHGSAETNSPRMHTD